MLNKYVILVTLVANCLSTNNDNHVESEVPNVQTPYGEQKCVKPTVGNADVTPSNVAEAGVYETYSIVCNNNYHMVLGAKVIVDIDPVLTCTPGEEAAKLVPETAPTCAGTDDSNLIGRKSNFKTQITANPANYAVAEDQVGCWEKFEVNAFNGGESLSASCAMTYSRYIDTGCIKTLVTQDYIFIGYNSLRVFEDGGAWGSDVIVDPNLTLHMSCVAASEAATVCKNVASQPATSNTKLYVKVYSVRVQSGSTERDETRVMNIKAGDSDVKYRLRCDNGYSFEDGIDDSTVYGYCTTAGTETSGNEFFASTTTDAVTAIHCYSKCPANPDNVDKFVTNTDSIFSKLYLPSMKKGETFTLTENGVGCADKQSLPEGAATTYTISCNGGDTTAAPNSGLLSCTGSCPKCYAMCTENPDNADKFVAGTDTIFSLLTMPALKKGGTVSLNVAAIGCLDAHSLAEGAPASYTITCSDADKGTDPNIGLLSCTDCPKCYAKCPANPANTDKFVAGTDTAFSQLTMEEMKKGGSVTLDQDKVKCADGHSLAEGAPAIYTITCSDADKGTDPNTGLLSCTDCPKCYALCPANPDNTDKFVSGTDTAFSQLTMAALKKDETATLTKDAVTCAANEALAEGAPASYTITCSDADKGTDPNTGLLKCTDCPKCYQQCLANPTKDHLDIPEDNGVSSLTITETHNFGATVTVEKAGIQCKDGYALSAEAAATFTFQCGASGKFTCTGAACPMCEGTCTWPVAADGIDYQYVDDTKNTGPRADHAIPGTNHVEAFCTNTELALLGPRYLSCKADNTMVFDRTGYTAEEKPTCQAEVHVCEAPVVSGALLQKSGNLPVGETYTITCNEGNMFDLDTQEVYKSTKTADVECVDVETITNVNLPAVHCYSGCGPISGFSGTIEPAVTESGAAPYNEGQVVTFVCQAKYQLENPGEEQQTCTSGEIATIPKCIPKKVEPTGDPVTEPSSTSSVVISLLILTFSQLVLWTL